MNVIALANQKGGVGKSSLCIHCAVAFKDMGESSAIIDMDQQQTILFWRSLRDEDIQEPFIQYAQGSDLKSALEIMKKAGIEWVFLDLPGRNAPISTVGINASDFVLVPTRADGFDLNPVSETVDAINAASKPFGFVLTFAEGNQKSTSDSTASGLKKAGFDVAPVFIVRRKEISDANNLGLGVTESAEKGKGASEFRKLAKWLKEKLS